MLKEEVLVEMPSYFETDYETERGKPMPSFNHSYIALTVGSALRTRYKTHFSIFVELDLDLPNSSRPTVPDLCIFPKKHLNLSKDVLKYKEPPLTVIEIVSPKHNVEDVKEKIFQLYFPAGVKSAWLIIPTARTVTVYNSDESFTTYASGKFTDPATGITLDLDEVFEGF